MASEKQKYGLIGKSLGHSFSKGFFSEKFQKENIAATYNNYELAKIEDFKTLLAIEPNLKGLNVTIPYKEEIIPFLDELDPTAKEIGAVNTIAFQNDKLIGYNTDAYGFQQSIKPFLRNVHERALILGTGGASKAIAFVLHNLGIDVCYVTRKPKEENQFAYNTVNELMIDAFKLIVNCTPVGTYPDVTSTPNIPLNYFTSDHLVIDLIYNPEKTALLKAASSTGAETMNGYSMLQHQALKAWEIWQSLC